MSAGVKLAGFALVLALVFGVTALAGGAIDPGRVGSGDDQQGMDDAEDSGHMTMTATTDDAHGDHGEMDATPGGLAIAEDGYRLALDRTELAAGEARRFSFRILDAEGLPVRDFEEEHGKRLHLILVRRDLTGYQHLHPELAADGTWSVRLELPNPGAYRVYADFVTGEHALTLGADLFAPGDFRPRPLPEAATVARADGYTVELSATDDGMLHFAVSRDGAEVTDLQRYLGARGHLVALREGDLAYLHVHPEEATGDDAGISFHAELPTAGRYRLFLQFRHDDRVHTVAFTKEVTR